MAESLPEPTYRYLLLTEQEYARGYFSWTGQEYINIEYELVQTFGDGESKKFLVSKPKIQEQLSYDRSK